MGGGRGRESGLALQCLCSESRLLSSPPWDGCSPTHFLKYYKAMKLPFNISTSDFCFLTEEICNCLLNFLLLFSSYFSDLILLPSSRVYQLFQPYFFLSTVNWVKICSISLFKLLIKKLKHTELKFLARYLITSLQFSEEPMMICSSKQHASQSVRSHVCCILCALQGSIDLCHLLNVFLLP